MFYARVLHNDRPKFFLRGMFYIYSRHHAISPSHILSNLFDLKMTKRVVRCIFSNASSSRGRGGRAWVGGGPVRSPIFDPYFLVPRRSPPPSPHPRGTRDPTWVVVGWTPPPPPGIQKMVAGAGTPLPFPRWFYWLSFHHSVRLAATP